MAPYQNFATPALLAADLSRLGHDATSASLLRPVPLAAALHFLACLMPAPPPETDSVVAFWGAHGVDVPSPAPPPTPASASTSSRPRGIAPPERTLAEAEADARRLEKAAKRAYAENAGRALRAAVDVVCGARMVADAGEWADEEEVCARTAVLAGLYRVFPAAVPEFAECKLRPRRARREPLREMRESNGVWGSGRGERERILGGKERVVGGTRVIGRTAPARGASAGRGSSVGRRVVGRGAVGGVVQGTPRSARGSSIGADDRKAPGRRPATPGQAAQASFDDDDGDVWNEEDVEAAHAELLDASYLGEGEGFATREEIDELVVEMNRALQFAQSHRETCESAVAMAGRTSRAERDSNAEEILKANLDAASAEYGRVLDALQSVRRVREAYAVVKGGDTNLAETEGVAKKVREIARRVDGYKSTFSRSLRLKQKHVPAFKV